MASKRNPAKPLPISKNRHESLWSIRKSRTNVFGHQKTTDQIVCLGYKISESSVKNILIENSYDPEPDSTFRSTWRESLKGHWTVMSR